MKYFFHPVAEEELNETIDYYNECQDGLGLAFAKEVNKSIQNIFSYPQAWPSLSKNTKRCLINRFPYGIIYQISDSEIYIVAIMQLNRKPKYWESRSQNRVG